MNQSYLGIDVSKAKLDVALLHKLGLDAGVRFWEYSVVRDQLPACERQAYLDDWGDSAFDPVGHFEAKWANFVEGQPYGRGNFSCYSNERVDELTVAGETEADAAKRQKIYDEAQQLVYDDAPAVFLILPDEAEAASVRVQNWEPAADSRINLHDVCCHPSSASETATIAAMIFLPPSAGCSFATASLARASITLLPSSQFSR
jgi:ABC-type oligopeptide transport system substrate-binding subunit